LDTDKYWDKKCGPKRSPLQNKDASICQKPRKLFEGDVEYFQGVQSSEMHAICIMADARDKSKMYSELFLDFYKYMEGLQVSGIAESEDGPYLHPIIVSYPWTRHQLQKKHCFAINALQPATI
jgi:hypothetical protein